MAIMIMLVKVILSLSLVSLPLCTAIPQASHKETWLASTITQWFTNERYYNCEDLYVQDYKKVGCWQ